MKSVFGILKKKLSKKQNTDGEGVNQEKELKKALGAWVPTSVESSMVVHARDPRRRESEAGASLAGRQLGLHMDF